ncbi:DnaA regulatory inactivator Hda [Gammaproteobacteria bacterium]|nr:DnaA regulatory inactivator Hda [Gammaproteobacteria bacterium]
MTKPSQLPFDFSLQNEFTFDNFVIAEPNTEVIIQLQTSTELPEQFYFIWGPEGAGKSHLFQALCQSTQNAVYVPLKKFAEYGSDILNGLENMDLVCLDDIEVILSNKEWEETLFQFFNDIREKGNKLFISALSPPRKVSTNLPDLASRLSWGVVYQLHELNDEDKISAVQLRAKNRGIPLNEEVLNYILLRSPRSMGSLVAVLDKLDQLSLAEKRKVTIPFVRAMMQW